MDPITIAMLLSLAGGAMNLIGGMSQGRAEREQAAQDTQRANQAVSWQQDQLGWQQDDLGRQKDSSVGTLLTQSYAMGVGGPSVSMAKGTTVGEFNRAISRVETQKSQLDARKDWNLSDLDAFNKQSKVNQAMGAAGTLLTTGSNIYGLGVQGNLWGPGQTNPYSGQTVQSWANADKKTRGSFFKYNYGIR